MEASAFGSPLAAAPEEQAPQQAAPVEQTAPAPTQTEAPADPTLVALQQLTEKVEGLAPAAAEPETTNEDLWAALEGEVFEPEPQSAATPEPTPQEQVADPEAMRQWEILQGAIQEEAQKLIAPIVERERGREMTAVKEKYPDIMKPENLQAIATRLGQLEAQTGAQDLWQNAAMVEQTYKVLRAEQAEASGVPAEQAASGAVLETNAGQSQTGGSSESEEYINQVFQPDKPRSVFG